ncbi:MAG: VOC family protein [Salinibacterium sp.]|nr:VOC family protein [Salinibacterium sp.]
MTTITPFLWFDNNADEAIAFYSRLFPDAVTIDESRGPDGTLFFATFELAGQRIMALNGGPNFAFTEAISLFVSVDTQEEVDVLWDALTADGGEESQCGWLKDKYGLSWQIIPTALGRLQSGPDREKAGRVIQTMLGMRKIVIAELEAAYAG